MCIGFVIKFVMKHVDAEPPRPLVAPKRAVSLPPSIYYRNNIPAVLATAPVVAALTPRVLTDKRSMLPTANAGNVDDEQLSPRPTFIQIPPIDMNVLAHNACLSDNIELSVESSFRPTMKFSSSSKTRGATMLPKLTGASIFW